MFQIVLSILNNFVLFLRYVIALSVYVVNLYYYGTELARDEFNKAIAPLLMEYGRFMTLFNPELVVWYSPRCLVRLFPKPSTNLIGRLAGYFYLRDGVIPPELTLNDEGFLAELSRYAVEPSYRRYTCVSYVSVSDFFLLLTMILLLVLLLWIIGVSLYRILHGFDPVGRVHVSQYIDWLVSITKQQLFDSKTIRKIFVNLELVKTKEPVNHTHPSSASLRNSGTSTMELFCAKIGVNPYFVQKSPSDVKNHRNGCRTYYWGKDISVHSSGFNPGKDDVVCIVDSDYYLNVPDLCATHVRTYLISTFQPTSVASDAGEYSFTFDENDVLTYTVSGGAVYRHKVWNYSADVLTVSSRIWYGFGVQTTVYNVDRKQMDNHHQLICLTPLRTFKSFLFDLSCFVQSSPLERLKVAVDGYLRLHVKRITHTDVSTGICGKLAAANITAEQDDALTSIARLTKLDITIAGVRQVLPDISHEEASILASYHRKKLINTEDVVFPISESVKNYQFDPKSFDPEANVSMHPFMTPLLNECYAPVKSKSNDEATVQGRIKDVKPPDDMEITPFDLSLMQEFVEFLVPDCIAGTGIPYDVDEVYNRQDRPSQRRILDMASLSAFLVDPIGVVKSFMKAEVYSSAKDPRNISTIPGIQKLNYSSYMYSFVDAVLKPVKWYAFSKTPLEIASRVAEICLKAVFVLGTDLSRFDGRVAKPLRTLENMYMTRWVHPDYLSELVELMASQKAQRAVTRFGVKYETGQSRLSGSPETSGFNSIDNAYMAYKALRMTRIDGNYMTPKEAWDALGIYGGDDGLTANADPKSYVKSCSSVGQKLEVILSERGSSTVSFLARIYSPQVWYGSPNSMCDIRRQLGKIHVTPHLPDNVAPIKKLAEKLTGFYLTDSNTPIIGEFASLFIERVGGSEMSLGIANYFARYPEHEQYPNEDDGEWMENEAMLSLPNFSFTVFRAWLRELSDLEEIPAESWLTPPMCDMDVLTEEAKVKWDIVINGQVYKTESTKVPLIEEVVEGGVKTSAVPCPPGPPDVDHVGRAAKARSVPVEAKSLDSQCKHIAEGRCKFGDKCNHLVKQQKCKGKLCIFEHGESLCKYGSGCVREGCKFTHPKPLVTKSQEKMCRKGIKCVGAKCPFIHPGGRVLPKVSVVEQPVLPEVTAALPPSPKPDLFAFGDFDPVDMGDFVPPAPRLVCIEVDPGPGDFVPPASPLVGIETNPGPGGNGVYISSLLSFVTNLGSRPNLTQLIPKIYHSSEMAKLKKNKQLVLQVRAKPSKKKTVRRSKTGSRKKKMRSGPRRTITAAGRAFQKCTLAPFDFTGTDFVGIPDEFDGQVITKNHRIVSSLPSYTTGHDLYIVQLPIPGIAYFYGDRAAGSTSAITLTAVSYDDTATLFPAGHEDYNVTDFRYASNVLEFVPTVNEMTWGGSVQVSKAKVEMVSAAAPFGGGAIGTWEYVGGLAELMNSLKQQAVFPLNQGAFSPAYNTEANFEWRPVTSAYSLTNLTTNQSTAGPVDAVITFAGTPNFTGLGTFEATVMKFPAIIASQSGLIRCNACIEYQVTPTSIVYDYAHMSPAYDPLALAQIKEFHKNVPAAVKFADNATFWETFLSWTSKAATIASYLPGPLGIVGTGIKDLIDVGHGLWT
jgi:hypothetical protein